MENEVTGEYLLPGKFPKKTEEEHFERYSYASGFVNAKEVLDIACGVGYGCKMLSGAGAKSVTGVDILGENIEFAKANYPGENITFIQNSIYEIDYSDKYDVITCFETIEHIPDDNLAIKKLFAALKNKGLLIISTPNRNITSPNARSINDAPSNKFHTREYILSEFKELLEGNGFKIIDTLGQRNRPYLNFSTFNRVINKIFDPENSGNKQLKKPIITQARYYTLVAQKIV